MPYKDRIIINERKSGLVLKVLQVKLQVRGPGIKNHLEILNENRVCIIIIKNNNSSSPTKLDTAAIIKEKGYGDVSSRIQQTQCLAKLSQRDNKNFSVVYQNCFPPFNLRCSSNLIRI